MTEVKLEFRCDVCGKLYQHGPHRYEGQRLDLYGGIFCCDPCWNGNWDGWAPQFESTLLEHIGNRGIAAPRRNAKGRLPRN